MARHRTTVLLLARLGMASLFAFSGLEKLFDYGGAVAFAGRFGVPLAHYAMAGAILLELGGAVSLIVPRTCRYAAAVLVAWTLVLGPWFHPFWTAPAAAWQTMIDDFFHHIVMAGGLLYVVAVGAGEHDGR